MQSSHPRLRRCSATGAVAALAYSVVLTSLCASAATAQAPHTGTRSASLAVSVSVVRSCVVATPARVVAGDGAVTELAATQVGAAVSLSCSRGAPAAGEVGPPSAQSALYAQLQREIEAARRARADASVASEPIVVTLLF